MLTDKGRIRQQIQQDFCGTQIIAMTNRDDDIWCL